MGRVRERRQRRRAQKKCGSLIGAHLKGVFPTSRGDEVVGGGKEGRKGGREISRDQISKVSGTEIDRRKPAGGRGLPPISPLGLPARTCLSSQLWA